MRSPAFRRATATVMTGFLALAACGGDDGPADTADPTTTTAEEIDVDADVRAAYAAFFDNLGGDLTRLQDGETFDPADMEGLRVTAAGATVSVNVQTVTEVPDAECETSGVLAPCATVVYDLIFNGEPLLTGSQGYAVFQDDMWKVAKTTFCGLAGLSGAPPAACA